MYFPLTEPVSPRYLYVNPETNQVHLLVPLVGGQEISTDNTCKATKMLDEFFKEDALAELKRYKQALALDIELLKGAAPLQALKKARYSQILAYIKAVEAMKTAYPAAIAKLKANSSNLYSIQLRPRDPDPESKVVNPVFSVARTVDAVGNPTSCLYNALEKSMAAVTIVTARERLVGLVLKALPEIPKPRKSLASEHGLFVGVKRPRADDSLAATAPDAKRAREESAYSVTASSLFLFKQLQIILQEQCRALWGIDIDFSKDAKNNPISKEALDDLMGFNASLPATPQEYIDVLLNACALNIWEAIPASPFYSVTEKDLQLKTERLSLITQFFLAQVNLYCKAKGLSALNFGAILDGSKPLSEALAHCAATAFSTGDYVEEQLFDFINEHAREFGLASPLTVPARAAIREKFERTYRTITATHDNPHFDDFMILDETFGTEKGTFVTHQAAICIHFAELVAQAPSIPSAGTSFSAKELEVFNGLLTDFASHPTVIPHKNEEIASSIDVDADTLIACTDEQQFARLSEADQALCKTRPAFIQRQLLYHVAHGEQDKALALLKSHPEQQQKLLATEGGFTDYSGRRFHCTAYEYAYWAKDTRMCTMLASLMDEDSCTQLFTRIEYMEFVNPSTGVANGLVYEQHGMSHQSAHFDFTPLKNALETYSIEYQAEYYDDNKLFSAWLAIGKAQRDLPAHVVQDYYCRKSRNFIFTPDFDEAHLPRELGFYNAHLKREDSWYPLTPRSGLGFDFSFIAVSDAKTRTDFTAATGYIAAFDLEAITRLDEVRTGEIKDKYDELEALAGEAASFSP